MWIVGLDERGAANLRRSRLQDALRRRARRRRQGPARSGAQTLRFSGVDPDAGESAVAECVGCGGSCVVRSRAPEAAGRIEVIMKSPLCVSCVLCGLSFCCRRRSTGKLSPSRSTISKFGSSRNSSGWARAARLRCATILPQPQKIAALQISSSLELAVDPGERQRRPVCLAALTFRTSTTPARSPKRSSRCPPRSSRKNRWN